MFGPTSKPTTAILERAAAEAAQRGDRRAGTEHLLLGLLSDASVAQQFGTDLDHARAAAAELDRQALATIGIDLAPIAEPAAPRPTTGVAFTSGARNVIARAVTLAHDDGARRIDPSHLLAALLERTRPDPVAELIHALGSPPSGAR